jgi:carboxynorspermidine synthase
MAHDEIRSLAEFIEADRIEFWMGFSDNYLKYFNVLRDIGMLSPDPVRTDNGIEVSPLKVLKAVLPDPVTLAPGYKGKTCIGDLIKGKKDGQEKEVFIYNICDHEKCFAEVGSQAISYTAGVPPVAAAMLVMNSTWDTKRLVNMEELDPDPFLNLVGKIGLPTEILEIRQ